MTNETIIDLSSAIDERGLFKLKSFRVGFKKIGMCSAGLLLLPESLSKNCPELEEINMRNGNDMDEANWLKEVLMDSLRDAGRTARVFVYRNHF